uniref:Uncharacterized protein n=1 Tax=Pediastrum duplex TaxID=3105 RepID=A0A2U8GIR9_PEDDU|nr:hypothetical protein [Pediastrum duplex]
MPSRRAPSPRIGAHRSRKRVGRASAPKKRVGRASAPKKRRRGSGRHSLCIGAPRLFRSRRRTKVAKSLRLASAEPKRRREPKKPMRRTEAEVVAAKQRGTEDARTYFLLPRFFGEAEAPSEVNFVYKFLFFYLLLIITYYKASVLFLCISFFFNKIFFCLI